MPPGFQNKFHWISLLEHLKRRVFQRVWSLRIRQASLPSTGVLTLIASTFVVLVVLFFLRQYNHHRHSYYDWDNEAEEIGPQTPLTAEETKRLETIFHAADKNHDKTLSESEIVDWIILGVEVHLKEVIHKNFMNFLEVDVNPRNGLVSWSEYLFHCLERNGMKGDEITVDDVRTKSEAFKKLPKGVKVEISRVEASWLEAANNSPDFLTVDEFLALEHREASPTKLLETMEELFYAMDANGDGAVRKAELESPDNEAGTAPVDPKFKRDFDVIDADGDGSFNRPELLKYMDPKKPHHAKKEAARLLHIADSNGDEQLDWTEVLSYGRTIVNSKLYDATRGLHKNFSQA